MDDTLYMGELVEPLGFDSIWATEHYGSAYSMQPNPLQYLAYWAGRTTRVDMGTAVIVAPWWNPVRLASEISMLDILLKGRRLHLGIGRGISPHEYASLGYPIGESHAYFYDVVRALKAADGPSASPSTARSTRFRRPPSAPRPATRAISPRGSRRRSPPRPRRGWPPRTGSDRCSSRAPSLDEMTAQVRQFNTIRAEMGLPPDQPTTLAVDVLRRDRLGGRGRVGVLPATSSVAAQHHYFEWNNPGFAGIPGYEEYLKRQTADVGVADASLAARRATQPIGTPDEIIEKIQTLAAGDQPRDAGHPHVLRRNAPRQGGEEPPAVRGEGPARRAGDADPDQSRLAGPAEKVTVATRGVRSL